MKYLILLSIIILHTSCATQNMSKQKGNSLGDLIKTHQDVYIENQTFEDAVDFTSFLKKHLISEGIYQVHINSGLTFKNCVFKKPVYSFINDGSNVVITTFGKNLSFIECVFEDEVNFRGSTVSGRTDFTKSTFKGLANFEETTFHQNTFFNWAKFEKEHRFQNSYFLQKANFMNTEYFANASFQSSTFHSELQLSASKFYKYADLSLIDCRGNALFNYTEFWERADLSNSTFSQNFDFVSTQNQRTNFRGCKFMGQTKFFKSTVAEALDFSKCFFLFGKPEMNLGADKLVFD
ncbi:MAG: pentapeptide repeat-containing protein [Bacteroidetes bacterium]|nr:pentapeptide repeat-containing protein [Bacteroidota bacterium]